MLILLSFLLTFVCFAFTKRPIIIHNGNNVTSDTMIRFPYKPLYGLPVRLNCPDHVRKEFNGCELYARDEWSISIDEYVRLYRYCTFDGQLIFFFFLFHKTVLSITKILLFCMVTIIV